MIKDAKKVMITECNFENLASNSESGGGALSISETSSSKAYTNSFIISSCAFTGCQGLNGGAISF